MEKQEEEEEEEKYTTFHSPLADESPPPRFHRPEFSPADSPVSYQTSHAFSPRDDGYKPPPAAPVDSPSPVVTVNRSVRDEPKMVTRMDLGALDGIAVEEGGGATARRGKLSLSILKRPKRERALQRAAFAFRFCGFLFCMISFSIMASDKNKGWTLDSFDHYKEFRYCLSVNVLGFLYSGLQGCDLAYRMTGNHGLRRNLRRQMDFFMDQAMTYLLISASSSAATRVEDWQSNWGEDKFPEMARASVWMSFLAFGAFALISIISGYVLFTFPSV